MTTLFKIFYESIVQALQQLTGNKLRSFLSLLGITIGIFCIIGVRAAVDSLEDNIRGSLEKLGDDMIYVQKVAWAEDPGQNYYRYLRRPQITYEDFEVVSERVPSAGLVAYSAFVGSKTIKYRSSNVERVFIVGVTYDFGEMFSLEYNRGRYFSPSEYYYGSPKVILGYKTAQELFGAIEPIGKMVKIMGRKLEVIGVIEEAGEGIIQVMNFDEGMVISYELAKRMANLESNSLFGNSSVYVKAEEGANLVQLKDEITGAMRTHRRLKPKEEDNFSLNQLSMLSNVLDSFFGVLNTIGFVIGIFAILVGAFSVANIMFVSVKERTSLIGIKKALGAKRYIILMEFLIEAIILCIIGGLAGLALIYLVVTILSSIIDFELFLSFGNIIFGLILSVVIGVVSGFIPALQASGMDPVNAMRQ